jgi:two-component system chemotaxis response regulator CheB
VPNRDIDNIVIGGSSGATTPLRAILSRFQNDAGSHFRRSAHSRLGNWHAIHRARGSRRTAGWSSRAWLKIENGQIDLAAPDHHFLLDEGHMLFSRGPRENLVRPAIDPLF